MLCIDAPLLVHFPPNLLYLDQTTKIPHPHHLSPSFWAASTVKKIFRFEDYMNKTPESLPKTKIHVVLELAAEKYYSSALLTYTEFLILVSLISERKGFPSNSDTKVDLCVYHLSHVLHHRKS